MTTISGTTCILATTTTDGIKCYELISDEHTMIMNSEDV